jgi:phosphate starvation-inducible PhoH-like protein
MAKKFTELRAGMTQAAREKADGMARQMLLTRVGFGSKVVITGDVSQIDVPDGRSGLVGLEKKLGHIDSLAFVYLDGSDVVRHRIVADIVAAYERFTNAEARRSSARKAARDD